MEKQPEIPTVRKSEYYYARDVVGLVNSFQGSQPSSLVCLSHTQDASKKQMRAKNSI